MPAAGGAGGVRIGVAFDDVTLEPTPTWTYLTATPHLAAGYQIDRGRQYEFDKVDTGTAVVQINDIHGTLDPTNSSSPYTGKLEPLRQIQIELLNPVTDSWVTRYRGFVEDYDYTIDPSQKVARLQISCVDLFEVLTAIEMQPVPNPSDDSLAAFGDNVTKQLADGEHLVRHRERRRPHLPGARERRHPIGARPHLQSQRGLLRRHPTHRPRTCCR